MIKLDMWKKLRIKRVIKMDNITLNQMKYWTYVFGRVVECLVDRINEDEKLKVKTEFGNYRNISKSKLFETKDDAEEYVKNNNASTNENKKMKDRMSA